MMSSVSMEGLSLPQGNPLAMVDLVKRKLLNVEGEKGSWQ